MSGRLSLRRGVVAAEDPLLIDVDGERRPAWIDVGLLGGVRRGDEVIVNVAALDLGLGSGGFDIVHVNLTRGLSGAVRGAEHVMKLNYTSLQHPVEPVEAAAKGWNAGSIPVLVLPLHGHLAPAAWATAQALPGLKVGYIQTAGGALPGSLSRDVLQLRDRGLLCAHITAAPAYGGEHEALSVPGALDAAAHRLGWDAVLAAPGPGIIGSNTRLGHGGMAVLESAHAALSLGMVTLISPRLSGAELRERHRGVSHHTLTVLTMLLSSVVVVLPEGSPEVRAELTAEVRAELAAVAEGRHQLHEAPADLAGYSATGLPAQTMGRRIEDDPLFFAAPLAAGRLLGVSAAAEPLAGGVEGAQTRGVGRDPTVGPARRDA
ncbi:MAG: DUF3866 family protein [Solirubrobacterales bacterium]